VARLVVLISGSGSNLQALLDASADGRLGAPVVGVVSNRAAAFGLERAARAGVPTRYVPRKPFGDDRAAYDAHVADVVAAFQPTLVVCAGWMHVLSPAFLDRFPPGSVINLHPALPGELPGVDAIERAWREAQAGQRDHTGVMVHEVIPEIDAGPVWATATVPILPGEALESLQARVHATEHHLLVSAIADKLRSPP
jgi:formyltetrahydrofolate-dependent phosphoribosylglycinamide formyltransferase